jgi:hypothetical protein
LVIAFEIACAVCLSWPRSLDTGTRFLRSSESEHPEGRESDAESDPAGVVKVPTNCTSIGPPETVFHGR